MTSTDAEDERGTPSDFPELVPGVDRPQRYLLPGALALVVLLAIGVTTWALASSQRSATRAERAASTASQLVQDSDAAAAARAAAVRVATDKAKAAAREKKIVDAAVKKALARKASADKKKRPPAPKIVVVGSNDNYTGGAYGTFGLTRLARPGPIHVYESPTDSSSKLYAVYPDEQVTVYCSVRGQMINGHDYWDWNGTGWVWDKMVDMNGHSPPPCGDY
jgi:hypothetical protein